MPALRILLLEDNRDTQIFLRELLCDEGYEVTVGSSPEEGITLAHQEPFDALLTDSFRRNDQEPLAEIRQLPSLVHPTPVGVITGWDVSKKTVRDQGFAFLIQKP